MHRHRLLFRHVRDDVRYQTHLTIANAYWPAFCFVNGVSPLPWDDRPFTRLRQDIEQIVEQLLNHATVPVLLCRKGGVRNNVMPRQCLEEIHFSLCLGSNLNIFRILVVGFAQLYGIPYVSPQHSRTPIANRGTLLPVTSIRFAHFLRHFVVKKPRHTVAHSFDFALRWTFIASPPVLLRLSQKFIEPEVGSNDRAERNNSGSIEVLEIVNRVRDIICPVHDFCFRASRSITGFLRSKTQQVCFARIGAPLPVLLGFLVRTSQPRILECGRECRTSQVQSCIPGMAKRERGQYAEGLCVSLEPVCGVTFPVLIDSLTQGGLTDVTEGRMPQIMCKASRFDHLRIHADVRCGLFVLLVEMLRQASSNLGDLERMGQSIVEPMTFGDADYLRNSGESTEGTTVENSIPISFKWLSLVRADRLGMISIFSRQASPSPCRREDHRRSGDLS